MTPGHIAIIMDGNGRWAKRRGWLRTKGHEAGAKSVDSICQSCAKMGVKVLSLYAFSTENWTRPESEVQALMKLLEQFLKTKKDSILKNNIIFNAIGDVSAFDENIAKLILNLKTQSAKNSGMKLNLALNYGAKDEIIRAFKRLVLKEKDKHSKDILSSLLSIDEKGLNSALDEPEPIDILIRTGGEHRISNFMLWQASYAELFFTDTLFPDFGASELEKIISDFSRRTRRFGGL